MRRMAMLFLLLGPAAWAQDAATELVELVAAYESVRPQGATREDRGAYEAKFREKFDAFAAKHSGTEEALTARLYALRSCWWIFLQKQDDGGRAAMNEEAGRISDRILAEFGESPRMAELSRAHWVFSAEQKERIFGKLAQESPHREVRGASILTLAQYHVRRDRERATELLRVLIDEYGDLPYYQTTYRAIGEAYLAPHDPADLEIGKVAPEIEGTDHLGKPMKLSDFRGKVVVLDFWGDW